MTKDQTIPQITSQIILSQLVSFCMRRGWSADEVLRRAGFDLAQLRIGQRLLTQDDLIPLLTSIALQKNLPDIALQIGQEIHSEQLGLFGTLVSSSPNLTVAVQRFTEFNQLLDDRFQLSISMQDNTLWLIYESYHVADAMHPFYSEILFSAVTAHANQLSRFDAAPKCIEFMHDQPDYANCYSQYFPCEVLFGKAQNRMQLPRYVAETPFTTQNTRYHTHALTEAKKLLPSQTASRRAQVSSYLKNHLADAEACHLNAVSTFLNCGPRTLQRELKAESTSLKQLLDEVRKTAACKQLKNTTASIDSVGQSVGFKHPSSFAAKFKQWTGMTPRQFRDVEKQELSDEYAE